MPKLEILTVAENSYNSDEYAAKWVGGDSKWKDQTLRICIGKDRDAAEFKRLQAKFGAAK